MKIILGLSAGCIVLGAIGAIILGVHILANFGLLGIVIGVLLFIAAADMIFSLFGKSLLKAGPIARLMYPNMSEGEKNGS